MLNFRWTVKHTPKLKRAVEAKLRAVAGELGLRKEDDATLVVCADQRIATLNERFRHLTETTDVLSFPCDEPVLERGRARLRAGQRPRLLGDVFVNLRQVERQAQHNGNHVENELAAVAAHGMLHLLGFDHKKGADAARMLAEEKRLFRLAGIEVNEFGH
jgi:probable rRNA maturation factor